MFLRKLGSTAAAKVLRLAYIRGQGVWWGATQPTASAEGWRVGAGRVMFLPKLGSTTAAKLLRRKNNRGRESSGELPHPTAGAAG